MAARLSPIGSIVVTPNALATLARHGRMPVEFIARHAVGAWSALRTEDAAENVLSVAHGFDGARVVVHERPSARTCPYYGTPRLYLPCERRDSVVIGRR